MSTLPLAVTEHLRVLGIQPGPITIHAVHRTCGWHTLWSGQPFTIERARELHADGVFKMELGIPGGVVSEFEIEELV